MMIETTSNLGSASCPKPDASSATRSIAKNATKESTPQQSASPDHFYLAAKSKAAYQPMFRYRRWLEGQKGHVPEGGDASIAKIETGLPPLRGSEVKFCDYIGAPQGVEDKRMQFYYGDGHDLKKQQ
ncbi:hypothetical protein EC991_006777 [Linnemannia zychae]|nr:hypothetical protein EC991_006777 [Linnemannia zychae]